MSKKKKEVKDVEMVTIPKRELAYLIHKDMVSNRLSQLEKKINMLAVSGSYNNTLKETERLVTKLQKELVPESMKCLESLSLEELHDYSETLFDEHTEKHGRKNNPIKEFLESLED